RLPHERRRGVDEDGERRHFLTGTGRSRIGPAGKGSSMKMGRFLISAAAVLLASGSATWAADGAAIFKAQCGKCHGDTGKADTSIGKAMKIPALAGDAKVQ